MEKIFGIAYVTILESFRRKDPYVFLILTFLLVIGAGTFSHFGAEGLGKFVKDIGFSVTNVLAAVICVIAAARQLPTEIQNRTLYPLLAKPISRSSVLFGKFVGVGVMATVVVILFSLELFILFKFLGLPVGTAFLQAVYLRILSMWFIAAMTLFLSLTMTQGANVTVALLLCIAMSTFSNTLLAVTTELEGIWLKAFMAFYWLLPHLELFDLSKKEVHGWPPVPMWVLVSMTGYALIYSTIFLALGCRRFKRLSL